MSNRSYPLRHKRFATVALALATLSLAQIAHADGTPPLAPDIVRDIRQTFGNDSLRYFDATTDLNHDGQRETLIYLMGSAVCGTGGCTLLVYTRQGSGFRRVATTSVTRLPVLSGNTSHAGWLDLIVHVAGGGASPKDVALSFDGHDYPSNPSVPGPRVKSVDTLGATSLMADFQSFDQAQPLPAATPEGGPTAPRAPSFDCRKATNTVERTICNHPTLSGLDRELATSYRQGIGSGSEWPEREKASQRSAQRAWLAERNACATRDDDVACITTAYRHRLVELKIRNGAFVVPTPVEYRCTPHPETRVAAVFYNQTRPPSAMITVDDRQVLAFVARSGSGARYTAPGVEWWEHQGEVTLTWFGKTYRCKVP